MNKHTSEVISASIQGFVPMLGGLLVVILPLMVYFSEKGWYRANKEALNEKKTYEALIVETNAKQVKLDQSMKAFSDNNEKAIMAKTEFDLKQKQLVADIRAEKVDLQREHADKLNALQAKMDAKEADLEKAKKKTDKLLADAQKFMDTAKTLEEEADKQFLKNNGDGEAIANMITVLKENAEALSKHCDNYDKTDDPFFIDVIEKRIFQSYKVIANSTKIAKELNLKFNNKSLNNSLNLADAQMVRAAKKLRGNVPK